MLPPRNFELISFDVGFTLIAPHPPVGEMYAGIAARFGLTLSPVAVQQRFEQAWGVQNAENRFRAPHPLTSESSAYEWWKNIFAAALGSPLDPPTLEAMFSECFHEFARGRCWRVFPDVPPSLERLLASGVPLAALSNWDSRLWRTLRETDLLRFFKRVFISSEIHFAKPHPSAFDLMCREMGVCPKNALFIGDSLHDDVLAAQQAGLAALWLDREDAGPSPPPGVTKIRDLTELSPQHLTMRRPSP